MLLGRVTYDGFAASWPSRSGDFTADKFNAMPKYVVSTTMDHADWNNSTIIAGDIPGQVRALRERENVIVWGSPTLVKTLMAEESRRRVRSAGLPHRARAWQEDAAGGRNPAHAAHRRT